MRTYILPLACLLVMAFVPPQHASGGGKGSSAVGIGALLHADNSEFTELPFGGGDISYMAAYEWHEKAGYWQIVLGFTPDVSGIDIDFVVTPEVNLIFTEDIWRLGLGASKNYISYKDGSDWQDFYWQIIAGIGLPPVGGGNIELHGRYVFDKWGNVDNFDSGDLEYGIWISFPL